MAFFNLGLQTTDDNTTVTGVEYPSHDVSQTYTETPTDTQQPASVPSPDTDTQEQAQDYAALVSSVNDLMATVKQQQETINEQAEQLKTQQADFNKQLGNLVQHGTYKQDSTAGTSAEAGADVQPIQQPTEATGYVPLRDLDVASAYIKREGYTHGR